MFFISDIQRFNPFNPEFAIVIFIHYKPKIFIHYKSKIAVAIFDLKYMNMIRCGLKITENYHVLVNQFCGKFRSKTLGCRKIKSVFRDVK